MKKRTAFVSWWSDTHKLPGWYVLISFLMSAFNCVIFVSLVNAYWWPHATPIPIDASAVVGLHIQLFEAFLAALSIGLAVFGFVGYATLKQAAERQAEETTRAFLETQKQLIIPQAEVAPNLPDVNPAQPGESVPEEGI